MFSMSTPPNILTKWALFVLCNVALTSLAPAEVRLNPLFSDGVVLQRGQMVPVWGTASEGEQIAVVVQGKKAVAICRDGRWRAELPALEAGGPFEMTIAGKNTVTLKNVLVGEVWM